MFTVPANGISSTLRRVAIGLLLGGLLMPVSSVAPAPASKHLYPRVRQIFADLLRFVPLPGQAQLRVESSGGDVILARAGQDHTVTLTEQAIALCYSLASRDDGDACIAFVLGHELAHLHLHAPYLDADLFPLGDPDISHDNRFRQHLETSADRWGFIYATMAGYPVETLLALDGDSENVFAYFQRILGEDISGAYYPIPGERAATIQTVFEELQHRSDFFRFGTVAAFFGDCDTAERLLGALRPTFDAPEVKLNLAYCQLRTVVEELADSNADPALCLRPLVGMQSPLLRPPIRRGDARNGQPPFLAQLRERLRPIHRRFHEITETNPRHLSAWVNQAIASFLAGYHARAEHEIIQARDILANDHGVLPYLRASLGKIDLTRLAKELESLVWLIKSREHEADLAIAVREITDLIREEPVPAVAQFNLIGLLEKLGQPARAAALRDSLRGRSHELPPHCRVAQAWLGDTDPRTPDHRMPYTLPEPLNASDPAQHFDVIYFPDERWARIKDRLERFSWTTHLAQTDRLSEFSFLRYRDRVEALRHEHQITFLVLRDREEQDLGGVEDLVARCPGANPFPVSLGEIWDCQGVWASWVVNGEIREVWMDLRSL